MSVSEQRRASAYAVAPGSFRTDRAGRSMVRTERSIPDYDALMDPVRAPPRRRRQPAG
ncbi:hypothetical protein [Nocardia brasiliensis]|uniref:hypothetical protein n=1 Tax=Nocardia brasiliensis TaxID=37326 RepID=UPI000AB45EB1|nr:hypothetical protein [Nocardia brasiliensis]